MKDTLPQTSSDHPRAIRSTRLAVLPPPANRTWNRKWLPALLILALSTIFAMARPRPPMPPYPEQSLNSWRFDGTSWLTNTRTAPLVYYNLQLVESWSGQALRMIGPSGLLALPNDQPDGIRNLTPEEGTIRLWFASDWTSQPDGTGPGVASRLVEFGAWSSTAAQGWWSLAVSPDGSLLGFLAQDANGQTTVLQAQIRWQAREWHQVALIWSAQETVLFLDGLRAATGPAVSLAPLTPFSGIRGFCIGSDVHGGQLAGGEFEEVFTFDRACSDLEMAADYARTAPLAALGPITVEEETAIIAAAISPDISSLSETGAPRMAMNAEDFGCSLWTEIGRTASNAVWVILRNTIQGADYQIWSSTNLSTSNWIVETNLVGAAGGQSQISIPVNGRAELFLRGAGMAAYSVGNSFDGMTLVDTQRDPPDTMGAVGPKHFVELLNGRITVYDKATGTNLQTAWTTNFFAVTNQGVRYPKNEALDPRIVYDQQSQRWLACSIDYGSRHVILAVSTNSNPINLTNTWAKYLIPLGHSPGPLTDHVTLGVDTNGIYLSAVYVTDVIRSNAVVAIKKPQILQGNLLATTLVIPTNELVTWSIKPVVNFDSLPTNGQTWLIAKGPPEYNSTSFQGGPIRYRRLHWVGTNAVWTDPHWTNVLETSCTYRDYYDLDGTNAALVNNVTAPQRGGTNRIDLKATGSRVQTAVIRDGYMWICQCVGLNGTSGSYTYDGNANGTNVDRSGAQWLKLHINATGDPLNCTGIGRVYDDCSTDPFWYYFPSLMVNTNGDMVMGFSGSSSYAYIGAYYSWRLADGTTALRPGLIKGGEHYYNSPEHRWGDYSATALDPTNLHSFWTVQQYLAASRSFVSRIRGRGLGNMDI